MDAVAKKSQFDEALAKLTNQFCTETPERSGPAVTLKPLSPTREENTTRYEYVSLEIDEEKRVANLKVSGPKANTPEDAKALRELGCDVWALKAFRELDDAILDLRFNERQIGLVVITTEGDAERVLQSDRAILKLAESDWYAKEILLHMKRVLKRLDLSARTVFAIADQGTCFAGSLFELLIAADRSFMLDVEDGPTLRLSELNFGPLPMGNGLSRLESRFFGTPGRVAELKEETDAIDTERAAELGLVTFTPDDIDWEDEVRIAIEERAAFSPDALTGMEASLRFVGPETLETKIFGRLSAWQNWIFQRPNAVGDRGGLTTYGTPERPKFNYERT
ncbi:MAG: hypothetical protein R3B07_28655 [Polyangiaceae bacterium]